MSLQNQIEKLNFEIKETKELLKLFLNGEDYFKHKIKKLKTTTDLDNLKEDDLKRRLDELTANVQLLKQTKSMISIYNDGSEKAKINLDDLQQFILSAFSVNIYQVNLGYIKNSEKLDAVCVFIIEDSKLNKLVFQSVSTQFEHQIQFDSGDGWVQNLLKINFKRPTSDLKQNESLNKSPNEESNQSNSQIKFNNNNNELIKVNAIIKSKSNQFQQQAHQQFSKSYLKNKPNFKNQSFTRKDLLLSIRQLVKENYPLPFENSLIKKTTKSIYKQATELSPMYALDCEMCKTENGDLDVTRISLVDEQLNVLLDELVMPATRIIDYLTTYSGITEETLSNVSTTLADIHQRLDELLPEDAILIGHSLNCDLQSLQISHPYVIDTSCIYNFSFEFFSKPSLKQLAQFYLNDEIQANKTGHCSIEDAKTAMRLVKLKLSKDITFGDNRLCRILNNSSKLFKPQMTLSEFFKFKHQNQIKIVYDYLDLEQLGTSRFIAVFSKHLNKIVDKINWSLNLSNSICIVVLEGICLINLN